MTLRMQLPRWVNHSKYVWVSGGKRERKREMKLYLNNESHTMSVYLSIRLSFFYHCPSILRLLLLLD